MTVCPHCLLPVPANRRCSSLVCRREAQVLSARRALEARAAAVAWTWAVFEESQRLGEMVQLHAEVERGATQFAYERRVDRRYAQFVRSRQIAQIGAIYGLIAFHVRPRRLIRPRRTKIPYYCVGCAKRLSGGRTKTCGAPECKKVFQRERMREWQRKYKAEHGVSYARKYRTPESDAEGLARVQAYYAANPEHAARRKQERWQRRRAQKLALPTEKFRHEDVYERDGWVCGLCTEPVDRELRYPDPMSPSLDHVTPLARGGHHVLENVQLAHLDCNVRKNARVAKEA